MKETLTLAILDVSLPFVIDQANRWDLLPKLCLVDERWMWSDGKVGNLKHLLFRCDQTPFGHDGGKSILVSFQSVILLNPGSFLKPSPYVTLVSAESEDLPQSQSPLFLVVDSTLVAGRDTGQLLLLLR